jgi:hypothetical protein
MPSGGGIQAINRVLLQQMKKVDPMQTAIDAHPEAGFPTTDIDVLISAN